MDLVNDLGNDVAMAMLIEKKHSEKIDSKEIISLITKIREVLEPLSAKDHSASAFSQNNGETADPVIFSTIASEVSNSH